MDLRTAFFADFGRAFKEYDDCSVVPNFENSSYGIYIGGISVSWSMPINDEQSDKTEGFQFNLGTN